MKTNGLRAAPALVGAIASVFALTVGSALGDSIRPAVRNTIRECTEIRNPGFYVLTRNLTAVDDCLVVTTSSVTIDLGGWVISGSSTGPDQTGVGIRGIGESVQDITVRNGTITGFADAINLHERAVVENVRAYGNAAGILAGSDSTVSGSNARGFEWGVNVGSGSIVSGNVVSGGLNAIIAGRHSIVSGNAVPNFFGNGIRAESFTTVSGNNVQGGDGTGIVAGVGSTVSGNTVHQELGSPGISVECPSNVIGNMVTGGLQLSGDGCTNIDNLAP